jgi:5-methylcytosine-specific restriction endonuclease McrA
MRKFTNWQGFCHIIIERDGNKCTECGDSRDMIEIEVNEKVWNWHPNELFKKKEEYRRVKKHVSNLEVHHKKEVSAGGDMWNPENCQTLCYNCHKKKTAHFNSHKKLIKAIHSGSQRTLINKEARHSSQA